jgi:Sigma-70 region 2
MLHADIRRQTASAAARSIAAAAKTSADELLVERIALGDRLAMEALFARHRTPVYRWLVRFVNDAALAEDLLSEVFLDVWRQGWPVRRALDRLDMAYVYCPLQGSCGAPSPDRCEAR